MPTEAEALALDRASELLYLSKLLPLLKASGVRRYDIRSGSVELYPEQQAFGAAKLSSPEKCKCGHSNAEHNDSGLCVMCTECAGWELRA